MIYGAVLAMLQIEMAKSERAADEAYLAARLKYSPPEDHAQIRREHADALEKRRLERETERRHQELCQAIRDSRRRSWL